MSNFEYDSFSPLHPVRKLRSDLEDLERAIALMEICYQQRLLALEQEMRVDFEVINRRIKQINKTDYWTWRKEA